MTLSEAETLARDLYEAERAALITFPGGRTPMPWDRLARDARAAKISAAAKVLTGTSNVVPFRPIPVAVALWQCPSCHQEQVGPRGSPPHHRCPDGFRNPSGPLTYFELIEEL